MPERDWSQDWETCEWATPGPWEWDLHRSRLVQKVENKNPLRDYYGDYDIIDVFRAPPASLNIRSKNDAKFIAESREALPYWLQRVRELEEERNRYKKALRLIEQHSNAHLGWGNALSGNPGYYEAISLPGQIARKALGGNEDYDS